ncbi:hypothetical protein [Yoonia sp. I 8.24]|uniref:hypothetical protein n=1 Tax=Yoonia sp. I 8.24 TaxID=1537229 RepID=UPI001EDFD98B|nr:hypothetical protein [Yoonia sp. I 8.24]MCG3267669.1 hypothetical protein [Yoonia sp. I 8.24]
MILRALISVTLALALALVGFGHQSVAPSDDGQATAYVLAGGSWADICGDSGDPRDGGTHCQACVISQTCALDAPTQMVIAAGQALPLHVVTPRTLNRLSTVYWAHGARAPPLA